MDTLPNYDFWKTTEDPPYVDPSEAADARDDALLDRP
jgi:hypothetical protein